MEPLRHAFIIFASVMAADGSVVLQCHCEGSELCSETGYCKSGCASGFLGPGCQIVENVAIKKRAEQSTTMATRTYNNTADRAVDGNYTLLQEHFTYEACSRTKHYENFSWWQVILDDNQKHYITNITLVTRLDALAKVLRNFTIYLSNDTQSYPYGEWLGCAHHPGRGEPVISLTCDSTRIARSVVIYLPKWDTESHLTLCEVIIEGYAATDCNYGFSGPGCLMTSCEESNCQPGICGPHGGCRFPSCPNKQRLPPECWQRLPDLSNSEWTSNYKSGSVVLSGKKEFAPDLQATSYFLSIAATHAIKSGTKEWFNFTATRALGSSLSLKFPAKPNYAYVFRVQPEYCLNTDACTRTYDNKCFPKGTCFRGEPSKLVTARTYKTDDPGELQTSTAGGAANGVTVKGTIPDSNTPPLLAPSLPLLQWTILATVYSLSELEKGIINVLFLIILSLR